MRIEVFPTRQPPPPPIKEVMLLLTFEEAQLLKRLVGWPAAISFALVKAHDRRVGDIRELVMQLSLLLTANGISGND